MARQMKASERRKGSMTSPVLHLLGVAAVLFIALFFMKRAFHNMKPKDLQSPVPAPARHGPTPAAVSSSKAAVARGTSPGEPTTAATTQTEPQTEPPVGKPPLPPTTVAIPETTTAPAAASGQTTQPAAPAASEGETQDILPSSPKLGPRHSHRHSPKESPEDIPEESPEDIPEESPDDIPTVGPEESPDEIPEAELPAVAQEEEEPEPDGQLKRRRRRSRGKPWLVGQMDRDQWHQQERVQLFRMPPLP